MQATIETAVRGRNVPARLPMRIQAKVKKWLDGKGYGFLDASPTESTVIFIHARQVPVRLGVGQRLREGETVTVTYNQLEDGRLRASKIEFPSTAD